MKNKEILYSWKAIAAYLERDIKTCYRWEKELGLPVHRIDDQSSRSKVFAYTSEIDLWLREKAGHKEIVGKRDGTKRGKIPRWIVACILAIAALVFLYFGFRDRTVSFFEKPSVTQSAFEEIEAFSSSSSVSSVDKTSILKRIDEGNLEPWQLYHQAKYYLDKNTRETNEVAIILFLRVINAGEFLSLAYLGLAQCYINNVVFAWKQDEEWLDKAENLVTKVGKNSHTHPEYFAVLAKVNLLRNVYFDKNTLSLSKNLIEEGINRFPDHPQLNAIAGDFHYLKFGEDGNSLDFDFALKYKEKAFWLNPYSLNNVEYAELLMLEKNFQSAAQVCEQIRNIDPTLMAKFRLGEIYYYSGALNRSEEIFDQFATPLSLKIASLYYKGMIASQRNQREAVELISREINLLSLKGTPPGFEHLRIASMYFGLGDGEIGYKYLNSFMANPESAERRFIARRYIDLDRNFAGYRNQEKFQKIIHLR